MPAAIVIFSDRLPSYIVRNDDLKLLEALNYLKGAPELTTLEEARLWLASLPLPSGWFITEEHAKAFIKQCFTASSTMTSLELLLIRKSYGLSRIDFATKLGYGGNVNSKYKQIYEMENDEISITYERAIKTRAMYLEKIIKETENDQ